jgi:hypothetical protein
MGPPSYLRSVVKRNVVMRRIPVLEHAPLTHIQPASVGPSHDSPRAERHNKMSTLYIWLHQRGGNMRGVYTMSRIVRSRQKVRRAESL